jgi:hypothetical protein
MSPIAFKYLPFKTRPDLTPYLIHLTKASADGYSGLENLSSILRVGEIWGSTSTGFVKGARSAACFTDVPFIALKNICTPENNARYGPYGVVLPKRAAYTRGARPVLYLSDEEMQALRISADQKWRVVRFEVSEAGWISWLHEREWRCPGNFVLPASIPAVVVKSTADAMLLQSDITAAKKGDFKCIPRSILPLEVICQGLAL